MYSVVEHATVVGLWHVVWSAGLFTYAFFSVIFNATANAFLDLVRVDNEHIK